MMISMLLRSTLSTMIVVFVLASVLAPEALASGSSIGLYLDSAGTVVCSEDTLQSVFVYLVAETDSTVAGFQARLDSEVGIYSTLYEFPTDCINIGMWPDIVAGYSEPLIPDSGKCLLATLQVLPTVSGGMYIHYLSNGDVFGLLSGNDEFFVPNIPYGGVEGPVLTFGVWECPEDSGSQGVDPVGISSIPWGGVKSIYRGRD